MGHHGKPPREASPRRIIGIIGVTATEEGGATRVAEVRFSDVTCIFHGADRAAVDRVDLTVRNGELFVLAGATGSGKSTLVRLLAGLETAGRGTMHIGQRDVTRMAPDRRGVALISGGLALFPRLSVADNIALPLTMRRVSGRAIRSMVRQAAERCGVEQYLGATATDLEFDLRSRIALARAIVRRPHVVCIDEPLDEGDAGHAWRFVALVARMQRELGITFVYVTGSPRETRRIADRIAVLDRGRVQQADVPAEIFDRPATLAVAELVGAGEMNFVETVVRDGRAALGDLRLPLTDVQVKGLTGERVVVGVRHCDLVIGAPRGFLAVVMRVNDVGSHALLLVRADICGVAADFEIRHFGAAPEPMRRVVVGVVEGGAHFFDRGTGRRLG
jgi:multiple sugar transport system ATP-binding protein